ncbi:hypothetical protein L1987_77321 [Smallanthus sonchifolius]|uniref:Uncharacterized protein n=1 Tax=Smallanthus sonchifolius TaxID=185202 RepID=A0ACB8Z9E7_9ASTR|nr:hypothetical protein L1987_77321 [Smallanthus sonchifolius]
MQAFRAMREIGIPEEKTKRVLKNLLKLYDKNWELIEQENYRALADAIFDSDDSEASYSVAEQMKKCDDAEAAEKKKVEQVERMKTIEEETQILEEPEKPLKRLRLRHQDDQASTSCINPNTNSSGILLKIPKSEVNELPESQPELQSPVEITVTGPSLRTDPQPVSPLKCNRNNGEQADLKKHLIKPKDEPLTDDPLRVEVPLALIMPESLTNGDTSTENNLVKEPDPTKTINLSNRVQETSNETNGSTAELDIASSSSGEIKISLRCKSDKENPKFSFKTEDSVLKTMEDKCLKSYKFLDPNFSLKILMKDMCECFLDLGSDHSGEPPVNTDAIPPTDPLKTGNDFEKETENGFEENNHFIPDETIDIAKGQESVVISLVNEVNIECPPSFHYIPKNAVFQNAYVNFSLARIANDNFCSTCFGNCLTSSTPCPCALQTGGDFAYTNEGTIKEDLLDDCIQTKRDPQKCHLSYCKECPLEKPKNEGVLGTCKGHLERSFIKECWLKCGCNRKCGNRVVQCGIRYKLQVFMTPDGKGWGLRALEDLPKGAFVCEFVGEVLTCKELHNRVSQSSKKDGACPVFLDAEWGEESELKEDEALCLDATSYGNVARFINHRCFDANLIEIPVEVENPDRHYYHLAFFTTRKVKALQELTRDYGIDFDDDEDPVKAFECQCGSPFCRDIKGSSGSMKRKCGQN